MKKVTLMFAFIGMIMLQSCTVNDTTPQPTQVVNNYTTANEVFKVTKSFTSTNSFSNLITFAYPIDADDMVLVYRLSGIDNGADVWKLEPETFYYNDGTLNFGYNYDFTKYNVGIYMHGNNLATVPDSFRYNQVFRIVILFGNNKNKSSNTINFSDYNATIKALNLENTEVKKLN